MAAKTRKIRSGVYETLDGRFRIEQGATNSACESPHPMRDGSYCRGGDLHEVSCWLISERGENGGYMHITWEQDWAPTKRAAVELVTGR